MKYEIGDFEIDLGKRKINCKLWTSLDERKWLSVKNENSTLLEFANSLIFPNIEWKPMTFSEFVFVCISLRTLSSSGTFTSSYICPGKDCERRIEFDTNLNNLLQFNEPKMEDEVVLSAGDVELTIHRIPTIELMKRVLKQESEQEQKYFEFYASIKSFTYKGKVNEMFTFDEVKEFIDSLPFNIFQSLYFDFFEQVGNIELSLMRKCLICGTETKVVFQKVSDFL